MGISGGPYLKTCTPPPTAAKPAEVRPARVSTTCGKCRTKGGQSPELENICCDSVSFALSMLFSQDRKTGWKESCSALENSSLWLTCVCDICAGYNVRKPAFLVFLGRGHVLFSKEIPTTSLSEQCPVEFASGTAGVKWTRFVSFLENKPVRGSLCLLISNSELSLLSAFFCFCWTQRVPS